VRQEDEAGEEANGITGEVTKLNKRKKIRYLASLLICQVAKQNSREKQTSPLGISDYRNKISVS